MTYTKQPYCVFKLYDLCIDAELYAKKDPEGSALAQFLDDSPFYEIVDEVRSMGGLDFLAMPFDDFGEPEALCAPEAFGAVCHDVLTLIEEMAPIHYYQANGDHWSDTWAVHQYHPSLDQDKVLDGYGSLRRETIARSIADICNANFRPNTACHGSLPQALTDYISKRILCRS